MREEQVFNLLPGSLQTLIEGERLRLSEIQEIRLRAGKPLLLLCRGEERMPGGAGREISYSDEGRGGGSAQTGEPSLSVCF